MDRKTRTEEYNLRHGDELRICDAAAQIRVRRISKNKLEVTFPIGVRVTPVKAKDVDDSDSERVESGATI